MPTAGQLQEAFRRRRAAGGPAEQTFATLVGLELRPRRLRDASTLWGSLRTRQGTEARDGVWMHPTCCRPRPTSTTRSGFREDAAAPPELSDEDFDAELKKLLDGPRGVTLARRRAGRPRRLARADDEQERAPASGTSRTCAPTRTG